MANGLQTLGTRLQGFGAGVAGQGQEFLQGLDTQRKQALLADAFGVQRALLNSDPSTARDLLTNRLQGIGQLGGDPSDTQALLAKLEGGDVQGALTDVSTVVEFAQAQGLLKGLTGPKGPERVKSAEITDGFIVEQLPDGKFRTTKVLDSANVSEGKASAVTKIFDNGTVVQALPSGDVTVKDPAGNVVSGDVRVQTLLNARNEQVDFAKLKAGSTKAAKDAINLSTKAFDKLEKISLATSNIDEGIKLIDSGARTGVILSKLPSITAASKQLDNLQKRMGLDVVSTSTFGALSESELSFALATALPKNLGPKDLRRWLVEKKETQQKLSNYLQNVAIFMGTPGNDVAGWLEAQRALSALPGQAEEQQAPQDTAAPAGAATVTSQAEFDALPSGAEFIENGQRFRKP